MLKQSVYILYLKIKGVCIAGRVGFEPTFIGFGDRGSSS